MQLRWAALLPAVYWMTQAGRFAFPGAAGIEAEFPEQVPRLGPVRLNEAPVSALMLTAIAFGYVLGRDVR